MSIAVELPALGESVVEGTITSWLVKEGDLVVADQPLVEISTDKVDAEIPSPRAGRVEQICVAEGQTVPVGTVLVKIAADSTGRVESAAPPPGAGPSARSPRATPVARRMAAEIGVDLEGVAGSGVAGRVMRRDLAAEAPSACPEPVGLEATPAARAPYLDYALQPGDRIIPMSPLRRIVAEHMVVSKATSPHVGCVTEVDLGRVERLRASHKTAFADCHGVSLTVLPFVVQATVRALREFPRLNASLVDHSIIEKRDVHIGIAVETEKGLVVPVIRHADRLSLAGLAASMEDLSRRARSKQLSPDELRGGTFTISNPGRRGNLYGFAIINQPQAGILRLGEVAKRPVVRELGGEDTIVIRPIMYLALSYDHRLVDGAPANAFLFRIRELLEEAEFVL